MQIHDNYICELLCIPLWLYACFFGIRLGQRICKGFVCQKYFIFKFFAGMKIRTDLIFQTVILQF